MDKKSPKGRKRVNKGDENYWDCSVCTFRNNAEAFKCSMCDVRKGTSTRKPRLNAELVAAQVQQAQALTPPPPTSVSKPSSPEPPSEEDEEENSRRSSSSPPLAPAVPREEETPPEEPPEDEGPGTSKAAVKKERKKKHSVDSPPGPSSGPPKKKYNINPAKLRNVDRSSATYHSVTVNDFTVVITEFKPKIKKLKKSLKKGVEGGGKKPLASDENAPHERSSPGSAEANGHEEAMRSNGNNGDVSDSRSS